MSKNSPKQFSLGLVLLAMTAVGLLLAALLGSPISPASGILVLAGLVAIGVAMNKGGKNAWLGVVTGITLLGLAVAMAYLTALASPSKLASPPATASPSAASPSATEPDAANTSKQSEAVTESEDESIEAKPDADDAETNQTSG